MSKAARKRFPGIAPYKGKSLTTNDLVSQPKEDADGAGPAPEGGDAIGIWGDRGILDGQGEEERQQESEWGCAMQIFDPNECKVLLLMNN